MAEVEVQCVDCHEKWWVKGGEVEKDSMPQCKKCFSIGVATGRARTTTTRVS